jgi:molybdopterin synthase sulfur carrier subunit
MRISFYATLRKIVGQKTIELEIPEPCRLQAVLAEVVGAYPELKEEVLDESGGLDRYVHIFVDGRSSKYLVDGIETAVGEGQTVEFFPAVAGG